jgi:hypothetical protein
LPEVGDIEPVEVFFDDLDAYGMVCHTHRPARGPDGPANY